jgi:hypothetical protein
VDEKSVIHPTVTLAGLDNGHKKCRLPDQVSGIFLSSALAYCAQGGGGSSPLGSSSALSSA